MNAEESFSESKLRILQQLLEVEDIAILNEIEKLLDGASGDAVWFDPKSSSKPNRQRTEYESQKAEHEEMRAQDDESSDADEGVG